ncbi:endonuclease/exonuclease/phosphatase family protein [Aliiglaciecola sp. SL4]|uniref:endonuclease/exonuclease/phosphatase family protein n=1 Tax=Aliiglaciecola sp. SL4 TaxID=3239806 RepID=UPI00355B9EB7
MLETSLICTTGFLVAITLLPLLPSNHWLCRSWEFPRVQIVFLILVNILLTVSFTETTLMYCLLLLNLASLIYQSIWIFPYTFLYPKEVEQAENSQVESNVTIKVITANVLMPNKSVQKLIDIVTEYKPDILVTLETNKWWQDALIPIHESFPYRVNKPLENLYGMHVYSKYEISDLQVLELIEKDIPSVHCRIQFPQNVKVKFHFMHPAPPSPTENETANPRDKELILIADEVKHTQQPTIVTGDLNDVAWSPTTRHFRHLSGLKDPRIGRGFFNTFHADYPVIRWPLDHLFHSQHFMLVDIKRLPSIDSDHFPLYTELMVKSHMD